VREPEGITTPPPGQSLERAWPKHREPHFRNAEAEGSSPFTSTKGQVTGLKRDPQKVAKHPERYMSRWAFSVVASVIGSGNFVHGPPRQRYRSPLHRTTYENSCRDLSRMCRIETAAFVVGVRGSPRGRPHDTRR
jgi:hypothetical protein